MAQPRRPAAADRAADRPGAPGDPRSAGRGPVAADAPASRRSAPASASSTVEWLAGTLGFAWSAVARGHAEGARRDARRARRARTRRCRSARASRRTSPAARAFVVLVDPARGGWLPGSRPDRRRDGAQRPCALAALPAPRLPPEPVHRGLLVPLPVPPVALRPARDQGGGRAVRAGPHGMDRYAIAVDAAGVLTIDTGQITLGPLPVALGQPGLIPPRVENGCA